MNSNELINDFFSKLYSGNINEFNKFIENNNLSINITNKNNENALHVIIKSDLSDIMKINFIKYLNSKNINVNAKDCLGNTPFNLACQKQLYNIMISLYNTYKNKINLYEKNNFQFAPIYYILKGQIVDEIDNYPSPKKFIKNDFTPKINDVSKLFNAVKKYVKDNKLFTNDDKYKNHIQIIKNNIKFELEINKSLVDKKIEEYTKKIIQTKNNLSSDFKYEFYNDIFNIIKESHPKTFVPINFESTKSLDNDGFYLKNGDNKNTDYKIHGLPTFEENLKLVQKNNLIKIEEEKIKYNEMIESLNPKKFFFPFFENIAHIYYCKEFSKNIEKLQNIDEKCNEEKQYTPKFGNQLNNFIDYINSLGNGNRIKKIASGKNHNLILTTEGKVYAFGLNNDGQCGIPYPDLNPNPVNEPTLIDGTGDIQIGEEYNNPNTPKPGKIKDIACGENHSLILNEAGTVFSFGKNDSGQCGYDPNQNQNQNQNPGPIWRPFKIQNNNGFENKNITSIACGYNHNLLLHQRDVFTFGDNGNGQLGRPVVLGDHNPTPLNLTGVKKIACGANHSMIIKQDGSVHGFGDDTYGQTGVNRNIGLFKQNINNFEDNRRNAGAPNPNRPLLIEGTGTDNPNNIYGEIVDVACGLNHTMILNKRDEVYSFGNNDQGQLGYNFNLSSFNLVIDNRNINATIQAVDRELRNINQRVNIIKYNLLIPIKIQQILQQLEEIRKMQPPQLEKIYQQLQLILPRVQQLQQQFQQLLQELNPQPQPQIIQISQQVAITQIQNLLPLMQNILQQLQPINNFNLTDNNRPLQYQINTKLFDYIINNSPAVGIQRINTFYTNNQGNYISQPLPITDTLKDYNDNNYKKIKSIACGANHSMIITEAGEVFSFGEHNFGKLGLREKNDGNYFNKFSPKLIFNTGYPEYGKIISASAGENHSLILNKKGNVFSFGDPSYGQLGIVKDGNPVNNIVTTPQKINYDELQQEQQKQQEQLNSDYIIRNNTLFKDFEISIDNLQKYCKASTYIYVKNIENGEEIFIYNNDDDAQNIFQKQQIGGDVKNSRRLALQIINNKNKLELKINNDSLGKGQFEIKFYNDGFNEIKSVDIKTNEFNELIDKFYETKLKKNLSGGFNNILEELADNSDVEIQEIVKKISPKLQNINFDNNQFKNDIDFTKLPSDLQNIIFNDSDTIESIKEEISQNDLISSELSISEGGSSSVSSSTTVTFSIKDFFKNKNKLNEFINFYNEIKNKKLEDLININELENFDVNDTYFDKSKLNVNYLEKFNNINDEYKKSIKNTIEQFHLLQTAHLNNNLLKDKDIKLNNIYDFNLSDDYNKYINNLNKLRKLNDDFDVDLDIHNDLKYVNEDKDKKLFSPAYQDFYYYFRYYILEKIIEKNLNFESSGFQDELNKIFKYYDFNTSNNIPDVIKATQLSIIGDLLDNILINKIRNVIFNEINSFIHNKELVEKTDSFKLFSITENTPLDVNLININNEFDVDLSQMNEKIKKIIKDETIQNELKYNLGNVLINGAKVNYDFYYTNNFFDINVNKQQFTVYNSELLNLIKINFDYDLIKSLIENQNFELLEKLKEKINIDNYELSKLISYIDNNKINNNKYEYKDFYNNYKYHLEDELKKIQNHKNIFKYYDNLVCTFIYFYINGSYVSTPNYLNDDLKDSLKQSVENISPPSDIDSIKNYSKTYIIKKIKEEFNDFEEIQIKNIDHLQNMLIKSNDVEDKDNEQLKNEFRSICSSIDLVVGNMYSKLLKRFLLEYLTDKYESEIDNDDDLGKLKEIITNIMTKVDDLINIKYDEDEQEPTEFTKKLVILHSEDRYQIKEYAELNEDNLFNEIVNLIKSNSYEKIEENDIVLTYLRDNINGYFKKYYKIAIKTLIACSSGINNYILYHNKFNKIKKVFHQLLEERNNKIEKNNTNKKDKLKKKEKLKNLLFKNYLTNDEEIEKKELLENNNKKLEDFLNKFKSKP